MDNQAFFVRTAEGFAANPVSHSPWNPERLHGRIIAGLLAHAIEQRCGDADYMPARLTTDLYTLPDFSPIRVETRVVRDGYRIKVIDAEFFSGDVSAARATCQLLRRTESPKGVVWSAPDWEVPDPRDLPPQESTSSMAGIWTTLQIPVAEGRPRRVWLTERRTLVEGEPLSPFTRAAMAADLASAFSNTGDRGLRYINSDVTLYLSRLPRRDWIGFDVVDHQAADGVAIGACRVYDQEGPIGTANVCALAQGRRKT